MAEWKATLSFKLNGEEVECKPTPSTCATAVDDSGIWSEQVSDPIAEEKSDDDVDTLAFRRCLSIAQDFRPSSEDDCSSSSSQGSAKCAFVEDDEVEEGEAEATPTAALVVRAAANGQTQRLGLLVGRGGDKDAEDENGATPLQAASFAGKIESVNYLCQLQADVHKANGFGMTPLYLAAEFGHHKIVSRLCIANALLDALDNDGNSPLHVACSKGHLKVVQLLCQESADLQKCNNAGVTPLLAASFHAAAKVVPFICEQVVSQDIAHIVDFADIEGWTPLYAAAFCGHAGIVQHLLSMSASVEHEVADGSTALNVALRQGHHSVVDMLQRALDNPLRPTDIEEEDRAFGGSKNAKSRTDRAKSSFCSSVASTTITSFKQLEARNRKSVQEERFQEALDQNDELENIVRKLQHENACLEREKLDLQEQVHRSPGAGELQRISTEDEGPVSAYVSAVRRVSGLQVPMFRRDVATQTGGSDDESQAPRRCSLAQQRFQTGMIQVMTNLRKKGKADAKAQISQTTCEIMELRSELKLSHERHKTHEEVVEDMAQRITSQELQVSKWRSQSAQLEQEIEENQRSIPLSMQMSMSVGGAAGETQPVTEEFQMQIEELHNECERLRQQLSFAREAEVKYRTNAGRSMAEMREEHKLWEEESRQRECRAEWGFERGAERHAEQLSECSAEFAVARSREAAAFGEAVSFRKQLEELSEQFDNAVEAAHQSEKSAQEPLRRNKALQHECSRLHSELRETQGFENKAGAELQILQASNAHLHEEIVQMRVELHCASPEALPMNRALRSECERQRTELRAMAHAAAKTRMSRYQAEQLVQRNEDLQGRPHLEKILNKWLLKKPARRWWLKKCWPTVGRRHRSPTMSLS